MSESSLNYVVLLSSVNSIVAIVLNLMMCPLIVYSYFGSSKGIGQYKFFLLAVVFVETVFAVCEFLVFPVMQSTDNYYFTYCRNVYAPHWISLIAVFVINLSAPILSIVLAFSFLYRYALICNSQLLTWFHKFKKALTFAAIFFVTLIICGTNLVYFMYPAAEKEEQLVVALNKQNFNLTGHAYIGLQLFNLDRSIPLGAAVVLFSFMPTYYWCFAVFGYTTIKIMKFFKKNSGDATISDRTMVVQKQLFKMLIFQTLTPLLTLYIPISIGVFASVLSIDLGYFNLYNSCILSFTALIDPFIIFYYVPGNRRIVANLIYSIRGERSSTVAAATK